MKNVAFLLVAVFALCGAGTVVVPTTVTPPYSYVESYENYPVTPGTTDESAALAAAELDAQARNGSVLLQNRKYYLASSPNVLTTTTLTGGNSWPHYNTGGDSAGETLDAPQIILAAGSTATIASAVYNSGTGLMTLTMTAPTTLVQGNTIVVYATTGTGSYRSAYGVYVAGAGTSGTTVTYTMPTGYTMTVNGGKVSYGGASIVVNGTLQNVAVVRAGVTLNVSGERNCLNNVAAFQGVGVIMANEGQVQNALILGNAVGVFTNNQSSWMLSNITGDNLSNTNITGMHAYSAFNEIIAAPILASACQQNLAGTISGVADNGAGIMRVTTSAAHNLATGDRVTIWQVGGFLSANWAWFVTVIDSTHFDLTQRADDLSPGYSVPTPTATLTAGSNIIPLSSMDGIAAGQTIACSGITGTPTITDQSVPASEIKIASGAAVTTTGTCTLTVTNASYVPASGYQAASATYRPGPCLYVNNSEAPLGDNDTCYGFDTSVQLDYRAGWTHFQLAEEPDLFGPQDPTSIDMLVTGPAGQTSYGSSIPVVYTGAFTALRVESTSQKAFQVNGGGLYVQGGGPGGIGTAPGNTVYPYGPPAIQIISGRVELNGTDCGGSEGQFYVGAGAILDMNGVRCELGSWALGSSLATTSVSGGAFGDISGATLRGPSVTLAVPNAAGTAFASAVAGTNNGVQLPLTSTVAAATSACTSSAKGTFIAVSDALSPTNGSAAAAGGSVWAMTMCNGTAPIVVVH